MRSFVVDCILAVDCVLARDRFVLQKVGFFPVNTKSRFFLFNRFARSASPMLLTAMCWKFFFFVVPCWAILGRSWGHLVASWAILGASWAILWPSWCDFEAILEHLRLSWGHLGAILNHLGAILGHVLAIWGHLGATLGPSWAREAAGVAWINEARDFGHKNGPQNGPPKKPKICVFLFHFTSKSDVIMPAFVFQFVCEFRIVSNFSAPPRLR